MSIAIEAFASQWRPRDIRTRTQWCEQYVWEPNMARGSRYSAPSTPWWTEPLDYSADNAVKEIIARFPTGAGKSTFVTCFASHTIAEEDGDILLGVQGNREAAKYIEKRLVPCFKQIPVIKEMLEAQGRFAVKKFLIKLPGKVVNWGGVNETNAQADSVRAVLIDEAWMAEHGLLDQFRARLHNRWNGRFVALGQGGMEKIEIDGKLVDTEWHSAWLRTDQREWCFRCPQCGEAQPYRLRCLKYERENRADGELDEIAVLQSAHYRCINNPKKESEGRPQTCDAIFEDKTHIRRMLCGTGRYVAGNERHPEGYHGWTMNALGIWYESWGTTAVLHAKAHRARKRGDIEPIKIFRQKRMAENYREEAQIIPTILAVGRIGEGEEERDYRFGDYENGEKWDGEVVRCMGVDIQLDHFWVAIQAFKADGSARLLYAGKISTESGVRELQLRMKVQPLQLTGPRFASWVFVDCGHDRELAFTMGGKYGWWAVRGEGTPGKMAYPHLVQVGRKTQTVYKFYSEVRIIQAASGMRCRMFNWLNLPIKRILEKMRAGYREPWEVPVDLPQEIEAQLFSEVERNGIFLPIPGMKDKNHIWDCLCLCTVGAIIAGRLPDKPTVGTEDAAAVSIDTSAEANGGS